MGKFIINSEKTTEVDHRPWGGTANWLTGSGINSCANLTSGIICIPKGTGHEKHVHQDTEELLFVLDGNGVQTVYHDDGTTEVFDVTVGDAIFIPQGLYHSTDNAQDKLLKLLAVYTHR